MELNIEFLKKLFRILKQTIEARFTRLVSFGSALFIGGIILLAIWKIPIYQGNQARDRMMTYIDKINPWDERERQYAQMEKNIAEIENSARLTLAQIAGGAAVLIGLYFAYQNVKVTEEGKLTDRFSKAVELLGNQNLDVRFGAIYALERISKDSQKDHEAVMKVLSAYVREHSPLSDQRVMVQPDIQAIITIIGHRSWSAEERMYIDLSGCNLAFCVLRGNYEWVNFRGARLAGADMRNCNMDNADFSNADLSCINGVLTSFKFAHLQGATLNGAFLKDAAFLRAYITEADTKGADADPITQDRLRKAIDALSDMYKTEDSDPKDPFKQYDKRLKDLKFLFHTKPPNPKKSE